MGLDTLATITSIVLGVIAIIGFTRSNTNRQFEVVNKHINGLKDDIRALNTRIDNILLSDRQNRQQRTT